MGNYYLYVIGRKLVLMLPQKTAYFIAECVSDVRYLFARQDRRQVYGNLKAIFPEKTDREIRRIRRRMFRNFAKYLVDFFSFPRIDDAFMRKRISVEGLEGLDEARTHGKGVIMLTAHLGNWELGGLVMARLRPPLLAVALKHKDERVNRYFDSQRQEQGMEVVPLGHAVKQCISALQHNKLIALVGDRDFSTNGVTVDFFGKPSLFPLGPAAFAVKQGSAIVPGFMVRNPDETYTLKLEKPLYYRGDGSKEDMASLVKEYVRIFEAYIRNYPDQWYMFRRFWQE